MMQTFVPPLPSAFTLLTLALCLTACGEATGPNGLKGPALGNEAQHIQFDGSPSLRLNESVQLQARASSGLPLHYQSQRPDICRIDAQSGEVTALMPGTCLINAMQRGNPQWRPAQAQLSLTVQFDREQRLHVDKMPTSLSVGSIVPVKASASSRLPVRYGSQSPAICTIGADTGRLVGLSAGTCLITFDQPGNQHYPPAPQQQQSVEIITPPTTGAPAAPGQLLARRGKEPDTLEVDVLRLAGGGAPITQYLVESVPAGIRQIAETLPIQVPCPQQRCTGRALTVSATNQHGTGPASAPVDVENRYQVVVKFKEPDYAHDMTEFHGSFRYNSTRQTVSELQGHLSEVMAGNNLPDQPFPDGMPLLRLQHQLSSLASPAGDGLLVTSFLLPHTNTLSADPRDEGSDGWRPGSGGWKHWGYNHGTRSAPNPGNAYVRIFVNTDDPTRPLTPAQLDTLAYADCTPQGMMGDDCMTGTSRSGYGTVGSMRGHPFSQVVTVADDHP